MTVRSRVGQRGHAIRSACALTAPPALILAGANPRSEGVSPWQCKHPVPETQELMAKRDAVRRPRRLAGADRGRPRARRATDRRRRQGVHRFRRRHRRAQPRPHARRGRGRDQASRPRRCCTPASRWPPTSPTSRSAGCSASTRPGDVRQEGGAGQLRRRGGRERGQDRPLPHRPRRRDHLRPRLPRPHAADHDADLEAGLQEGHGPVRARGLPGAGALPLPRRSPPRTRWRASTSSSRRTSIRPVGGLRDPRAGAGRGRLHGDAARVHPGR